jgi:hypothetical protein
MSILEMAAVIGAIAAAIDAVTNITTLWSGRRRHKRRGGDGSGIRDRRR